MYRYQIKKGAENREFTNCRRISENVVESDELLNSSYLDLIEDKEQTQMTATADPAVPNPPANPPQAAPVAPPQSPQVSPQNPPQNQTPKEAN